MNHLKRSMLVCMFAFVLTTLVTAGVVQAAGLTSGKWSIVPSPNPGSRYNELGGVAAISANDIWAVGKHAIDFTSNYKTLIEHGSGSLG